MWYFLSSTSNSHGMFSPLAATVVVCPFHLHRQQQSWHVLSTSTSSSSHGMFSSLAATVVECSVHLHQQQQSFHVLSTISSSCGMFCPPPAAVVDVLSTSSSSSSQPVTTKCSLPHSPTCRLINTGTPLPRPFTRRKDQTMLFFLKDFFRSVILSKVQ